MRLLFVVPALITLAMVILSLLSQRGKPKGLVNGRLAPLPMKPNGVSSEPDTEADKRTEPLAADKDAVIAAIIATGGVIVSETDDYISATYTTRLMRFVDDVECRKDHLGHNTFWHVRSASRVGHSDMGVNRKRVAAIRAAL